MKWMWLTLIVFITGCGIYSFRGLIPEGVESVAIPLMVNGTPEPMITETITDQVINEFMTQGVFRLASEEDADAILLLTLVGINEKANTYTDQEVVQQMRVTLNVQVRFLRLSDQVDILNQRMNTWGVYSLDGGERQSALDEASSKLVTEITDKLLSGW